MFLKSGREPSFAQKRVFFTFYQGVLPRFWGTLHRGMYVPQGGRRAGRRAGRRGEIKTLCDVAHAKSTTIFLDSERLCRSAVEVAELDYW